MPDYLGHLLHRIHRQTQRVMMRVKVISNLLGIGKLVRGLIKT